MLVALVALEAEVVLVAMVVAIIAEVVPVAIVVMVQVAMVAYWHINKAINLEHSVCVSHNIVIN